MSELEMCCGTTCDKAKVKAEFEAIKRERDELAARVERLRQCAIESQEENWADGFDVVIDDDGCTIFEDEKAQRLWDIAHEETPRAALEALKAKWQAELATGMAEAFKEAWPEHNGKYYWMIGYSILQRTGGR